MDEERLQADEYEKQYYGFSSTEVYEDFKEKVCKAVKMALKEVEIALKEQQYDGVLRDQKIVEIYTTYMESTKVPLQKFKEETIKIFAIPKNVVLDEDKYNSDHYSDEDIIQLKKEVAELERELLREQVFLAKCKEQREITNKIIKPLYEKLNDMIKFLKNSSKHSEVDNNYKKMLALREEYIQYYFNNEGNDADQSEVLDVERNFIKITEDFFK